MSRKPANTTTDQIFSQAAASSVKESSSKKTADDQSTTQSNFEIKVKSMEDKNSRPSDRSMQVSSQVTNQSDQQNTISSAPDQKSATNIYTTPLLSREKKTDAMDYGFSFDSKKIAMGPGFFNLRIICDCLGKAIRRHIDYSEGELWFLDDKLDLKRQRRRAAKVNAG